ncbi:hypothetical protein Vafri_18964 [Volvox africanus]|uniref:Uncharacterized protein n=1 Tax=Volvox africanus TaxID=51714 RepID=A0A8J4F8Y1_9CHLO|nr:hypothetical protein Vafri_18964 [Volvox africanus]
MRKHIIACTISEEKKAIYNVIKLLSLLFLCRIAASEITQAAAQLNDVELVQRCFNALYNSTPTTFGSFMISSPVSLNISQVWRSAKESSFPLTVFSTATMDRVHHLESLCHMLPGSAVSAAVYLPLVQPHGAFLLPRNEAVVQETQAKLQEVFNRLEGSSDTCSLRLLLLTEVSADRALASLVPINALRNAALLAIRTPLAAMIDVDLAISDSLKSILSDPNRVQAMQQAATSFWVLPAWESESHLTQQDAQNTVLSAIKGDKQRLGMLWQSRHLRMFSEDIFPQGHNVTDYRRWLSAGQPYSVRYARGYEPWGITRRI